ncbi:MAG: UvrB/UvrC motif-containing protein [Verrucomicrobia bacterium]|nr:UvrB/UvrC motif-containing protein [Verrucomicrobiota bacterium]MDI9380510.1 UvrB/UvrC motif-containing protein [Verrucomicrobiota bacterium]NMD19780.1 excinuclease ABC subunit B [Verrucomicrobiota bacterium]HNU98939.1 UvrB/UvrC motif-containing protein [Verrucomicrobiota bacterium]HOA59953.1 UvrB/UvrC motif-containing protein [Verrucomicrobiota bacterium]
MLCMVCKQQEATVHLTQVVEGKIKKLDLCEACSKAKGVDDPTGFSLADLLMGLGASQEIAQAASSGESSCPTCGFTQADFKKSGRLGCPDCYRAFSDGLEALLKTMHKGHQHVGKAPGSLAGQTQTQSRTPGRSPEDRLQALQRSLEEAIKVENYEEAARIRDEIKALKVPNGGAVTA